MTEAKLNRRQRLYVESLLAGKSKRQAALVAGYSPSCADNPGHNIERGRVRELFGELIRATIPAELIAQRVREGLDSKETRVFAYEGRPIYSRLLVNYAECRQYAELAARALAAITWTGRKSNWPTSRMTCPRIS